MISMIVATGKNNEISANGELPWHFPEDLKHFKKTTKNKTIVMGRKTWQSLPFKPLPHRTNVILSKTTDWIPEELPATLCTEVSEVLEIAQGEELMIIGGEQIYKEFLPYADTIYLTHINLDVPSADTFFLELDDKQWDCYIRKGESPLVTFKIYKRK